MTTSTTQRLEHTTPYLELSFEKKLSLITELVKASIPSIGSFATGIIMNIISVYYLSKYGDDDLVAGYGLGLVFTNAVAVALIFGLNQAGNILMSQTFGAKNYKACGLYFQKSVILLGLLLPPLFLALFFANKIMTTFSIQEKLADIAAIYTRIAIPALIGNAAFDTMKSFITSHKVFYPIAYIQLTNFIVHFLWCQIFIDWLQLGVQGAVICKLIEDWTAAAIIYIYIRVSKHFKETWIPWTKEVFDVQGLWAQLKFSLPIIATTYVDWIYYEIMTLISGTFEAKDVVAHIAVANTSSVNFFIGMGIAFTMSTYISNAIGKQAVNEAKNYFYTGIVIVVILAIMSEIIFVPLRDSWAIFWSLEADTQVYLVEVVTIFCVTGLWIDNINCGQFAFLRAIGEQKIAAVMVFSSTYLVGAPLMILFTFLLDYKVKGLWIAFGLSKLIMAIWGLTNVMKVNWTKVMTESRERLEAEKDSSASVELKATDKTERLLMEEI